MLSMKEVLWGGTSQCGVIPIQGSRNQGVLGDALLVRNPSSVPCREFPSLYRALTTLQRESEPKEFSEVCFRVKHASFHMVRTHFFFCQWTEISIFTPSIFPCIVSAMQIHRCFPGRKCFELVLLIMVAYPYKAVGKKQGVLLLCTPMPNEISETRVCVK